MKKIFVFLSLCFALSTGFAGTEPSNSKDPEIVAFMVVLNKNEIAAADLTKQKKVDKAVKSYAKLMLKEHTQNLLDTEKLSKKQKIKAVDTEMVVSLQEKGKEELNALSPLADKAYETAYINAMVKGHTDAAASINNFLKEVSNPKLKAHLETTLTHVQHHLAKAEEIQKTLS